MVFETVGGCPCVCVCVCVFPRSSRGQCIGGLCSDAYLGHPNVFSGRSCRCTAAVALAHDLVGGAWAQQPGLLGIDCFCVGV
jgi:hypothetical protein